MEQIFILTKSGDLDFITMEKKEYSQPGLDGYCQVN